MKLDNAFLLLRDRKGTIGLVLGLSLLAHISYIGAIFLMGTDLGLGPAAGLEGVPLITYLATVPIILISSSVPLLPGGWGFGELMFGYFFRTVGVRNLSLSISLSVLIRTSTLAWSMLGGVFYVMHRQEARSALEESRSESAIKSPH